MTTLLTLFGVVQGLSISGDQVTFGKAMEVVSLGQVLELPVGGSLFGVQHVQAPGVNRGLIRLQGNPMDYRTAVQGFHGNLPTRRIILTHETPLNYDIEIVDSLTVVQVQDLKCGNLRLVVGRVDFSGAIEVDVLDTLSYTAEGDQIDIRARVLLMRGASLRFLASKLYARKLLLRAASIYMDGTLSQNDGEGESKLHLRAEIILNLYTVGRFDEIYMLAPFMCGSMLTESRKLDIDAVLLFLFVLSFRVEGLVTTFCDLSGRLSLPTARMPSLLGVINNLSTIAEKFLPFLGLPYSAYQTYVILSKSRELLASLDISNIGNVSDLVEILCALKRLVKISTTIQENLASNPVETLKNMSTDEALQVLKAALWGDVFKFRVGQRLQDAYTQILDSIAVAEPPA